MRKPCRGKEGGVYERHGEGPGWNVVQQYCKSSFLQMIVGLEGEQDHEG